jgi:hypothetical protein
LTPLEAAVQRSWKPVVRTLSDAGAEAELGRGKYGTAIDIARQMGQQEALKMLEASQSLWVIIDGFESVPVNANGSAWGSKFWYKCIGREPLNTGPVYGADLKLVRRHWEACKLQSIDESSISETI